MKRILSLFIIGIAAVGMVFGQAVNLLDPVATVGPNRVPITVKQFRTEVERVEAQNRRALTAAEKRQVLDTMINERLITQAAERDKFSVTDNDVNQQLQQLRASLAQSINRQPTEAEFAQAMRNETGLELPAVRDQLRRMLLIQKYTMQKKPDFFANIKEPTEADITNSYALLKSQLVRPDTVRCSVIRVPFADAMSKIRAKEAADRLAREIGTSVTNFDATLQKGLISNAEYEAGDGGYFPRNLEAQQAMGADFINTAFTLKQGEVSKLLETPQGFLIIKITETYEQKSLELNDIIQLGTRVTVREFIRTRILQGLQEMAIAQATQELVTELRSGNSYQIIDANLNL